MAGRQKTIIRSIKSTKGSKNMGTQEEKAKRHVQPNGTKVLRAVEAIGMAMEQLSYGVEGLVSIRLKGPQDIGDEYLLVARAIGTDGEPVVAFHSSESATGAVIGFANRMRNGTLKWHEDEYARR